MCIRDRFIIAFSGQKQLESSENVKRAGDLNTNIFYHRPNGKFYYARNNIFDHPNLEEITGNT